MSRKLFMLALVSVLTVIAMCIAFADWHPYVWLDVLGVVMALILPGYALSMALLPGLEGAERLLVSLGVSLVIDVLGGFALYVSPWGLRPTPWAVWLGGITLVSSLIAALRRSPDESSMSQSWPGLDLKVATGLALALAILAFAVSTAQFAEHQKDLPFTQLWAVPVADGTEAYTLQVGIGNQENKTMRYDLMVESEGERIEEWQDIELAPNRVWTARLSLTSLPVKPIHVQLYDRERPGEIYRTVQIAQGTFPALPR